MNIVTRTIASAKLGLSAKAPTLLVAGGIVAMGTAAVMVGKQTLKIVDLIEEYEPELAHLESNLMMDPSYSEKQYTQDLRTTRAEIGVKTVRIYAVPAIMFAGGAAMAFGGHNLLMKRNAALAVAFTGLSKSFEAYRAKVRETFGPEADQAIFHGFKQKTVIDEKGKESRVWAPDEDHVSTDPYAVLFSSQTSSQWSDDNYINTLRISQQQRFAQQLLARRGHVYLSEVYDALGIEETPVSRVVGWKTTVLPDGTRHYPTIDFGLDNEVNGTIINGEIFLDFNCQGLIVGGQIQKIIERG